MKLSIYLFIFQKAGLILSQVHDVIFTLAYFYLVIVESYHLANKIYFKGNKKTAQQSHV